MPFDPTRIVPANAVPDQQGLNILVYGVPGAGKTTFCASAADVPQCSPVLLVDVGAGSRSIAHRDDIDVIVPQSWEEMGEILAYLRTPASPYRTVIVDTLSELSDRCMQFVLRGNKRALPLMTKEANDYAEVNRRMLSIIRAYRDLATAKGCNVLFTAWEVDRDLPKENTTLTRVRPDLSPAVIEGTYGILDSVVRLTHRQGKRMLTLRGSGQALLAKFRVPPQIEIPTTIDDPTIAALFKHLTPKPHLIERTA